MKPAHPRLALRRSGPLRYLAPIGDGDIDRWVGEGLSAFGSPRRSVVAGAWAGAALPVLLAIGALLFTWANNWFAPYSERASLAPLRFGALLLSYGPAVVQSSLLLAATGALFAWMRRALLRLRLGLSGPSLPLWGYLIDSRLAGAVLGWLLYAAWALWPRGEGVGNFSGALYHTWIWVFFGVLFSAYLHWGQLAVLYRLYYWDWEGGTVAVVRRLLFGTLRVGERCRVEADGRTGAISVYDFPRGQGADRLRDLLRRIPGVQSVAVHEAGLPRASEREILTIHVSRADRDGARPPLVAWADTVFTACALSGLFVYVAGLVAIAAQGRFFALSPLVVGAAIQVEVVGLAAGYAARTLLYRRAQRELPREFERVLHFAGKELKGFVFGGTWEEARVVADLSREEAAQILAPVAARFGLRRLLVEVPIDRSGPGRVPRRGRVRG